MKIKSKTTRLTALIVGFFALLIFPFIYDIYYTALYVIFIFLFLPAGIYRVIKDEAFERRFFKRWEKARQKGFWRNVFPEGLRSLFIMVVVIGVSQFFGNGRTPLDIMSQLPPNVSISLVIFLIVLNFVIGIVTWYENEKRYERLRHSQIV